MNAEQGFFDEAEAKSQKIPTTFNDFVYDNETGGGIIQGLTDSDDIMEKIRGKVEDLSKFNTKLANTYKEFTNFNETIDSIITSMNSSIDTAHKTTTSLTKTAVQAIEEHMTVDSTLMDDLSGLKSVLSRLQDEQNLTSKGFDSSTSGYTGY